MCIDRRTVLHGVVMLGVSIPITGCLGSDNAVVNTTVNDSDTFRFEASAGEDIVVDVDNQGGEFTVVELVPVDDRDETLVSEPVEAEREITVTAPESGRYELSIVPGDTASVTVTVE